METLVFVDPEHYDRRLATLGDALRITRDRRLDDGTELVLRILQLPLGHLSPPAS